MGVYRPLKILKDLLKQMFDQFVQTIKDWCNEPVTMVSIALVLIMNLVI